MRHLSAALVSSTLLISFAHAQGANLAVRLGPRAAAWQIGPYQGKLDAVNVDGDVRPATAIGPSGLVLTTAAPIARDTELLVRFRITLPKGQGSGFSLVGGQKKPGDSGANALGLQFWIHPTAEPETLTWTLNPMPGEKQGLAGSYTARTLPANRLLMPDMTRRRIEQDFASEPTLTKRWLTLRYELRKHAARVWLDGRLLREARRPEIDTTGFVRLTLSNGVQVAEVALRDLPPPGASCCRCSSGSCVARTVPRALLSRRRCLVLWKSWTPARGDRCWSRVICSTSWDCGKSWMPVAAGRSCCPRKILTTTGRAGCWPCWPIG